MLTDYYLYAFFWLLGLFSLFRIPYCDASSFSKRENKRISVIIPARDEEKSLPNLLSSLKQQELDADEVILVDDNSADKTPLIAEQWGAMVIKAGQPPVGWLGKTWACHLGAEKAKGDILIFLDADTALENDGLRKIVDTLYRTGGAISIQPFHRVRKLYEELSAFFNIILMTAMGCFSVLGERIRPIGLFGPAVAIPREQYQDSGGHASVRGKVVEDLAFGRRLKKQGIAIHCYGGKNCISFRMYPGGVGNIIEGWSKGLATGARSTYIPLLLFITAWIIGALGTVLYLVQFGMQADGMQTLFWGILYCCFALQIYWMLRRIGSFGWYTAAFYVIPLVFFVLIFLYSLFIVFIRRRVDWKSRSIKIGNRD